MEIANHMMHPPPSGGTPTPCHTAKCVAQMESGKKTSCGKTTAAGTEGGGHWVTAIVVVEREKRKSFASALVAHKTFDAKGK